MPKKVDKKVDKKAEKKVDFKFKSLKINKEELSSLSKLKWKTEDASSASKKGKNQGPIEMAWDTINIVVDNRFAPKQVLWERVTRIPLISDYGKPSKNKDIIFVSSIIGHPLYAYSSYLSILSLLLLTDIGDYTIRVYVSADLASLASRLFYGIKNVELLEMAPDSQFEDFGYIKTKYLLDPKLKKYKIICGIDADIYAAGPRTGKFKDLINLPEWNIAMTPQPFVTDHQVDKLGGHDVFAEFSDRLKNKGLNKSPYKNLPDLLEKMDKEVGVEYHRVYWGIKNQARWWNSSLFAFHSSLIDDITLKYLDFCFGGLMRCDESIFTILAYWRNLPLLPIRTYFSKMDHKLESDPIYADDKEDDCIRLMKPLHLFKYDETALTHTVSDLRRSNTMSYRFQEYIDWIAFQLCYG